MRSADDRRDPDDLLKAVTKLQASARGRLRIFLGMCPGVGKTYAMLQAARALKNEGRDVVVGLVETHGRAETAALTSGLEILPRQKLKYRDVELEEMDLDGLLARRPQVALVDELAHTNAPGSRHPKRYQDVIELLDAGIDVITTVNVQHLESRKEPVEKIAQVTIRETVPDSVLDAAVQIEVVDLDPTELLKRLKEGKVYLGERSEAAARNFFQIDRLTALREMALRVTAERVDHDLQSFLQTKSLQNPWRTNERLMVAVSHSPHSPRLIRATRRLAYNLEAPWIAVHVDNGRPLNDADQAQLAKNMDLVRELNGEIISTTDRDIAEAIKRVARQKNVTQVILGRPSRRWIRDRVEGNLLDRLVLEASELDVHVIRLEQAVVRPAPSSPQLRFRSAPLLYWNTFWFIAAIGIVTALFESAAGYRAIGFVYLLAVLIVGSLAPLGPTLFAAILSGLVWNLVFIPPRFSFAISEPADIIMCLVYVVVAGITGLLTNRIRFQERSLREREERTQALFEVSQDIASSATIRQALLRITDRVGKLLGGRCAVYLVNKKGQLHSDFAGSLTEKEYAVAQWALDNQRAAGWSTDTLADAGGLTIPLLGNARPTGVFVYSPSQRRRLNLEQENVLEAVTRQIAVAVEKESLESRARESSRLRESEKLHQTLLSSISHEMRTPLTAILGAVTALSENANDPARVRTFADQLYDSGERLNRVIGNLLDLSRLNSGVLSPKPEWQDVAEIVHFTLRGIQRHLQNHKINVQIPEGLPLVEIDFRLFEHALANVILNAALYSPANTEITVRAREDRDRLLLSVEDRGPGLPDSEREKVFEKFYRVPGTPAGGTGVGLTIARGLTEAHGGRVFLSGRAGGGTVVTFELPIRPQPSPPAESETEW